MAVNLRGLIAKLNAPTRSAVEAAAGLCLSRTNYDVEIEHFLVKVLDSNDGDLAAILKHFGINRSRLADDLAPVCVTVRAGLAELLVSAKDASVASAAGMFMAAT